MITKFLNVDNLAVFQGFVWDSSVLDNTGKPLQFLDINIIYGRNYSGKTTLSRILRAMEMGTISKRYDNPTFSVAFDDGSTISQSQISSRNTNIRVFNEDFVRENLRFINNPEDNIVPFAVLGDNNNTLEAEIKALELDLGRKDYENETGLYLQLATDIKSSTDASFEHVTAIRRLDALLTSKATGRDTGIKYKPAKFGDQNYNKPKLENDICIVLSDTYTVLEDDQILKYELLLNERAKPMITPLQSITLSWRPICAKAESLLGRQIGVSAKIAELLRDSALNEWVRSGRELHEGHRDTCALCGNIISSERWNIIHNHFDEETKNLEDNIHELIKNIETEITYVNEWFAIDVNHFYSKYHSCIMALASKYKHASEQYVLQLEPILDQLNRRLSDISAPTVFTCPADCSQLLSNVIAEYDEVREQSNLFTTSLSTSQGDAQTALRLHEVSNFVGAINYTEFVADISQKQERLHTATMKTDYTKKIIREKEKCIQDKKRLLIDEEKGALKVNSYLSSYFGHQFLSLRAIEDATDGIKNTHFEIVRDGKHAYNLSQGECNLIAFCYFMAKLDDVETKNTNPIIWIDDPISSLDGCQ